MNWKGSVRKRWWSNLYLYPGICLEGLRTISKFLSQYNGPPGRGLNLGPLVRIRIVTFGHVLLVIGSTFLQAKGHALNIVNIVNFCEHL
jgi:hypothetical protein